MWNSAKPMYQAAPPQHYPPPQQQQQQAAPPPPPPPQPPQQPYYLPPGYQVVQQSFAPQPAAPVEIPIPEAAEPENGHAAPPPPPKRRWETRAICHAFKFPGAGAFDAKSKAHIAALEPEWTNDRKEHEAAMEAYKAKYPQAVAATKSSRSKPRAAAKRQKPAAEDDDEASDKEDELPPPGSLAAVESVLEAHGLDKAHAAELVMAVRASAIKTVRSRLKRKVADEFGRRTTLWIEDLLS